MSDTAIQFDHVGKLYKLGLVGTGTLSHDLNRWWKTSVLHQEDPYLKIGETNDRSKKGSSDYVWALKDITFDVKQGDVVGIIGKNGAGKSTLLKLLSRVTSPTAGTIRAKGRIGSLLEVGTGFHPELTGRENIYMNGSIMGMTRQEITRKLDEIVDFAGVERYLDTPVKRYSSGMTVRLGFAVAAFMEPEILVVDEVLAVGDAEFQKKAIGKMQDVSKGEGRTVLFVSHNMASVKNLCSKGVLLENGHVSYMGTANETIDVYVNKQFSSGSKIVDGIYWTKPSVHISSITINDNDNSRIEVPSSDKYLDVVIKGVVDVDSCMNLVFRLKTKSNVAVATFAVAEATGESERYPSGAFTIHERIKLPDILSEGVYNVDIILLHPNVEYFCKGEDCAEITFQGHTMGYGQVMHLSNNGFMGLKRYKE